MGCQDLLESVPGRGRVTSVSATPGSLSDGKSMKVRAALSGRSANGKTTKADDLSCKSPLQLAPSFWLFYFPVCKSCNSVIQYLFVSFMIL